jgi:hypothetical protein
VADLVIGQPNFLTNTENTGGLSASSLRFPFSVAVDAFDNLYVADGENNRVLQYNTPLTTDTVADLVIGQPDFATGTCNTGGISASSLCTPLGLALDAAANLYVSDSSNNRVLEYDTPLAGNTVADLVIGQPDFVTNSSNTGGLSASSMSQSRISPGCRW